MAEICGRFLVSLHSFRNNSRSVHHMQSDISQKHLTIHPAQYWTLLKWTSFWSTILHFFPNWVRSWRSPNLDAFNISPIWYNTKCFCSLESSIMSKFLILDSLHSTLNNKVWPVGKIPLISLKDVQKLTYSFPKIASKWKLKKKQQQQQQQGEKVYWQQDISRYQW